MMFFSDTITLRAVENTPDAFGQLIPVYTDTIVFANRKSATRSEFYSANMAGIKIDEVFEVHAEDYGDQLAVIYNSQQYEVIRTYRKGGGVIELNCVSREVVT